jgi:cathepsin L
MLQSQHLEAVSFKFDNFVQVHGRNYDYGSDEYKRRRSIFAREVDRIAELNSRPARLWTAGVNHLSDWTPEEFQALLGWRGHARRGEASFDASLLQSVSTRSDSESHLWDEHLVGDAADQGACGSCWAVATSKMLEANFRIHTRQNRTFSAQEIMDCTPNPMRCGGEGGCHGATVELAMAQTSEYGVATAEEAHYIAKDYQCKNAKGKVSILKDGEEDKGLTMKKLNTPDLMWTKGGAFQELRLQYWHRLPLNSGEALRAALLKGTVAVSADASGWSSYSHGIFDECSRDATINHAIVALGFGTDTLLGEKFWTILNSWGPSWGENGRIRLLRSADKYCGTDYQPEQGTACKGGPSTVAVCGMCGLFYDNVFAQFA